MDSDSNGVSSDIDFDEQDNNTSPIVARQDEPRASVHENTECRGPSVSRRLFCGRNSNSTSTLRQSFSNVSRHALVDDTPHNRLPVVPEKSYSEPSRLNVEKSQSQMLEILKEVKESNKKLSDVTKRLESVEEQLKSMEEQATSLSTSTSEVRKKKIPPQVRHLIRDIYKTQLDLSEDFTGFNVKKSFSDVENHAVVAKLIDETRAQDGAIPLIQIKDSLRRFFQTKVEEAALKEKGSYSLKVQRQRRRNRIVKKLESRKAALERTSSISAEKKVKWKEVLVSSFVSSEESDEEDVDGEAKQFLYVKALPWRAAKVSKFMKQIDDKVKKAQSNRARQQTLPRKPGSISDRPKPVCEFGSSFWGFNPE